MRRLLLFDVLADDGDGGATATAGEVGRGPQRTAPQLPVDARIILFTDHAAGNAFQAVDQCRHRHFRRVIHQEVHMVFLPIEFHPFGLEVRTDAGEDAPKVVQNLLGEYAPAIFGNKDQMDMHQKDAMPTMPDVVVAAHRPSIQ